MPHMPGRGVLQFSQRGAPYLYGEVEGLGLVYSPQVHGDCNGYATAVYSECSRTYAGATGKAQYCTERSRAAADECRRQQAAAPAPAPSVPTAPIAPAMPTITPTTVRVTTRTLPYEVEFEAPQRGVYYEAPPPTREVVPTPATPAPPPAPTFTTYGYAPANGFSRMYQPPSPALPPARIDAEEQAKLAEAKKQPPGLGTLLLIAVGAYLIGGR